MKIIREMSYSKSDAVRKFMHYNEMRIEHLIMVYLYPHNDSVEHWINEISAWCRNSYRVKPRNKLLAASTLYDLLWIRPKDGYTEQRVRKFVDYLIIEKHLPEVNYSYHNMIKYLESFFLWLSNELSQEDFINPSTIRKYVYNLLDIYR